LQRLLATDSAVSLLSIAVEAIGFAAAALLAMAAFGNLVTRTQRGGTMAGSLDDFAVTLATLPVQL
jgi:hypothetical protein